MTTPTVASTVVTVQVEIEPMNDWYEMRPTADGVEIVNPHSDPMYVSRENLTPAHIAEVLSYRLRDYDFNGMWTVASVAAPPVRGDEEVAAAVLGMGHEGADTIVKIVTGALGGLIGALASIDGALAPTEAEMFDVYRKSLPKMLASPAGAESLHVVACLLLARHTVGARP